jgi:hypothetical protein
MLKNQALESHSTVGDLGVLHMSSSHAAAMPASTAGNEISENEEFREILRKIEYLTDAERNLVTSMMSARHLGQLRVSIRRTGRKKTETQEIALLRDRAASLVRRSAEVQNLIHESLSFFHRLLELESDDTTKVQERDLEQMSDRYSILENAFRELYQENPEDFEKVRAALDNANWDFRTVESIAKETGLPKSNVIEILEKNQDVFRKSPVADKSGRNLFTLASRRIGWRERLAALQTALRDS